MRLEVSNSAPESTLSSSCLVLLASLHSLVSIGVDVIVSLPAIDSVVIALCFKSSLLSRFSFDAVVASEAVSYTHLRAHET